MMHGSDALCCKICYIYSHFLADAPEAFCRISVASCHISVAASLLCLPTMSTAAVSCSKSLKKLTAAAACNHTHTNNAS